VDYQKINNRWVYGLTLSVFGRNLVTYIIIAFLNAILGIAQGIVPFVAIFTLIVMVYLGGVSFLVAHRTILQGETISPGEAFAITPQSKTYFWQYLFVNGIPLLIGLLGGLALVLNENLPFSLDTMVLVLLVVVVIAYNILMAFFGTSLVATAVGGDGMMMASRGRVTFFYSLTRLLVLPTAALASFVVAVYYGLLSIGTEGFVGLLAMIGSSQGDVLTSIILMSIGVQLVVILFNLITAVIITKAFLLAEVRLALKGEPTEWGKLAFGISEQARGVVYR